MTGSRSFRSRETAAAVVVFLSACLTWLGKRAVSFVAAVMATSSTAGGSRGRLLTRDSRASTTPASLTDKGGSSSSRAPPRPGGSEENK